MPDKKMLKSVMRVARRFFRNTPVQKLAVTTWIYKRVSRAAFGTDPVSVDFMGAQIQYPGGDYTTLPSLVDGTYEREELTWTLSFLSRASEPIVALDIGANVGIWTCVLAQHPKVAHVYAFEPSVENRSWLRENLALNGCESKVTIVNAAVSNYVGLAPFLDAGSGATRRISPSDSNSTTVEVTTVDHFVRDNSIRPDFAKIDVEGYEPLVIQGMTNTIERFHPVLMLEFSNRQTRNAGTTWNEVGPWLFEQYEQVQLLDGISSRRPIKFDGLTDDNRLLSLLFGCDK